MAVVPADVPPPLSSGSTHRSLRPDEGLRAPDSARRGPFSPRTPASPRLRTPLRSTSFDSSGPGALRPGRRFSPGASPRASPHLGFPPGAPPTPGTDLPPELPTFAPPLASVADSLPPSVVHHAAPPSSSTAALFQDPTTLRWY
ncbi:putative basic proline-rich protein-like [Iris pallida]|uniref:Basic proline-rich protein-like n=1 Tax=Iris pallida TaxID=29817 RepID=A0AAX6IK62_IRIPA|nr:putative basic proline-rich protein-like [Iris pallida]